MQFLHFCHYFLSRNTLELTDNSISVSYINKQGGTHSPTCNKLTIEVWEICIQHLSHLSGAHIPGKHNIIGDLASRKFQDSTEWMISTDILIGFVPFSANLT